MGKRQNFTFIDLFAGIGGFHAALSMLGGECVFASEIDEQAAKTYEYNWNMHVDGDITKLTGPDNMQVPEHTILSGGFPCQPFSKSGKQRGMSETRGTLFFNIEEIVKSRKPPVIMLENVRNLAGPRHKHEWDVIINNLRNLGYKVSSTPLIFSPHLLPPELGGRPQVRERVFILGIYVGKERAIKEIDVRPLEVETAIFEWDPQRWNLYDFLDKKTNLEYDLSIPEKLWVETWDKFIEKYRRETGHQLPSFPLWSDEWMNLSELVEKYGGEEDFYQLPKWKTCILTKNAAFYEKYKHIIDEWFSENPKIVKFPPSRRKLEWQAQDAISLSDTIMHFRPSGIRVKKPTYAPALVAITQTTILGKFMRRLTPREAARLQAFPEWYKFDKQADAATYKQLGNAVNINVIYWLLRRFILQNSEEIGQIAPELLKLAQDSPENGDDTQFTKGESQ